LLADAIVAASFSQPSRHGVVVLARGQRQTIDQEALASVAGMRGATEAEQHLADSRNWVSNYLFLPLLLPLLPFPLLLLASALPLPGLTDLSLLSLPWPWSICCAGGSTAGKTGGVSVVWVVA